jgi:hypothetical protein
MGDIEKIDNTMAEDAQRDIKKAALDTTHTDEAMKILANYDGDETWTEEEEKHLVKRIDRKLLSLLVCTYGLQYYDKAMLSQAVRTILKDQAPR